MPEPSIPPHEPHPVFRTGRHPISLPSDVALTPTRHARMAIAVLVLVAALIAGLSYTVFWDRASKEAERLLPGTSTAFLQGSAPDIQLMALGQLKRWMRPADMRDLHVEPKNPRLDEIQVLGGLPYLAIYNVFREASAWYIARVPTATRPAVVALFKLPDRGLRERLVQDLAPHFVPVDRVLGHDIFGLERRRGALPWEEAVLPIHFLELAPYLLISYGPLDGVRDVLEAKVGTTSQSVRGTRAYEVMGPDPGLPGLRGYIQPGTFYDAVTQVITNAPGGLKSWRGAWVSEVSALTWENRIADGDDVLGLRLHLSEKLLPSARSGAHTLLATLPADAWLSMSVGFESPEKMFVQVEELLRRLHRRVSQPGDIIGLARRLRFIRTMLFEVAKEELVTFERTLALSLLGVDGGTATTAWVGRIGVKPGFETETHLAKNMSRVLGSRYRYETRHTPFGRLYLAHATGSKGASGGPPEALVWRLNQGIMEFASSSRALARLDDARDQLTTLGDSNSLKESTAHLHESSDVMLILHPSQGPWSAHPIVKIIAGDLVPSFRLALSARFEGKVLDLRANMGLWTLFAAMFTASDEELDAWTLRDLPPPCRRAFLDLCQRFPSSATCQAANPERVGLAREACRRIRLGPKIQQP